jgi:hypothetical protein
MKIHVYTHPYQGRTDFDSLKLFDFYYAYQQYLCADKNYVCEVEITFSTEITHLKDAINIGWFYMPEHDITPAADKFDLVFFDNGHHHLEICTETIFKNLSENKNCYLVSGAYLDQSHEFFEKIIYFPIVMNSRDYIVRPFYPQFYDLHNRQASKIRKNLILINGESRGHRRYLINLLTEQLGSELVVKSTLGGNNNLNYSFFQSKEDTEFREFILHNIKQNNTTTVPYYDQSPMIGIDGRYGLVPPGYFLLDEYFDYNCVIFPESCWLNNELMITEKIFKCCISRAIPWPVAGANTNKFYNRLGYQTACNLLPEMLQYDNEQDHQTRYEKTALAVAWVSEHPEIWQSELAQSIRENNYNKFFSNTLDATSITHLDKILNECRH